MAVEVFEFAWQFAAVFAVKVEEHFVFDRHFDAVCFRVDDMLVIDMFAAEGKSDKSDEFGEVCPF